jgi:hemolysin III
MEVTLHADGAAAETANSITHGLGAVLSVLALVLLTVSAALRGSARHVVGCVIFGCTLVLLYTMSTLYHALRNPRAKRVFHILDHSAIYLLIAGTYTPFCLSTLRGGWGWSRFGVVWGLAALGVAFKSVYTGRFEFLSTAVYLAMSWMVLIAAGPLWRALPARGLAWLLGGGVCYTGGVVFYGWHRLKFHHAVWHLFVLAGSLCHVVSVIGYVIPRGRP